MFLSAAMKLNSLFIFLILISLLGCRRSEPFGALQLSYINSTSASIRVVKHYNDMEVLLFEVDPHGLYDYTIETYGGVPAYQGEINQFFVSDSIAVIFNDTLKVIHLVKNSSQFPGANEGYLGTEEMGNIINVDNYYTEYINRDSYRATYTFAQEDLSYAVAINE